jgi:hypothetical protein
MSSITGDLIASNKISVEKYLLDEHLEVYLKTKTRSAVSVCIDYIYGLILLPKRKNMSKMAIYCCKCSNNQSLRNDKNIISSISVTDIVFDDYLGNGIIELFPK